MTEPITCPRCHRAFGGEQAYRRGHRWYNEDGRGKRRTCRRIRELRRSIYLRLDDGGVWHMRAPDDPGQMLLPLFGRGRPRRVPIYAVRTRNRVRYLVRRRGRRRPDVSSEAA